MAGNVGRLFKRILLQSDWIVAVAITGLIIWLHFFFLLHVGGFWRDEVNLINLSSRHSFGEMEKDSFPILMPLLVKLWSVLGLGQSDLTLRILGVLIGLGIPAALWFATWKIHRAPPLLGLVLLCLNSTVILFGDSLRAYGIGSLTLILTFAAACSLLAKPTWPRAAILAIMATLSVQALYQNAPFIAAVCFGAWVVCAQQRDGQTALKILVVAAVSAGSLLPYWPHLSSFPEAAKSLRIGFQAQSVQANLGDAMGFPLKQYVWVWVFFSLAAVVGALAVLRGHSIEPGRKCCPKNVSLFAGVTLLAAAATFEAFLWFASVSTQRWYFIPLMAFATVCFETSLPQGRRTRVAIMGFALATVASAIIFARNELNSRMTNIDFIAQRLNVEAGPNDFIIVSPWYCGISFDRYFKGAATWNTLPPLEDHSIHRYDLVWEYMKTRGAIQPALEKISTTLQSGGRVWLVTTERIPLADAPWPADPPSPPLRNSGWSDWPYNRVWAAQVAQFVRNHSQQFTEVSATNRNVVPPESMALQMAEGWRNTIETNVP